MKKGVGCRIGGVTTRRVIIRITPQGPTIDGTFALVDLETRATVGVTRKTRDWPTAVQKKLVEFVESLEEAAVPLAFLESEGSSETSIAEHLGGDDAPTDYPMGGKGT